METQKFVYFFKKSSKFEFWLVLKRWNHSFVNISPTIVIDTSMERSSRVLQHGNIKVWFFFQKNSKLNFDLYFVRLVFFLSSKLNFDLYFALCQRDVSTSTYMTTSGMHRRPFEGRHLVSYSINRFGTVKRNFLRKPECYELINFHERSLNSLQLVNNVSCWKLHQQETALSTMLQTSHNFNYISRKGKRNACGSHHKQLRCLWFSRFFAALLVVWTHPEYAKNNFLSKFKKKSKIKREKLSPIWKKGITTRIIGEKV